MVIGGPVGFLGSTLFRLVAFLKHVNITVVDFNGFIPMLWIALVSLDFVMVSPSIIPMLWIALLSPFVVF